MDLRVDPPSLPEPIPNKEKGACWNCNKTGHLHRNCPLPQIHYFCFLCGATCADKDTCVNPKCIDTRKNDLITGRLKMKPYRLAIDFPVTPSNVLIEEIEEQNAESIRNDEKEEAKEDDDDAGESEYNIEDALHIFD